MNNDFWVGLFTGSIMALAVGLLSYVSGSIAIKEQAVAANVAHYVVDSEGKTSFKWRTQGDN